MIVNNINNIFSKFIKSNQVTAYSQRLINRLNTENQMLKSVRQTPKNVDKFVASQENNNQTYKATHQSSIAYKAMPEPVFKETSPQTIASPTIELEITPPAGKVRDLADIVKGTPLSLDKFSPFGNIINGHYFSSLNAKLATDGNILSEPFTSEALNKTYQLSNQLLNVNMRNNEGGFCNRDLHGNLAALANAYDIMYKDMTADNNGQTHFLDEAMRSHLYFNAQQSMFAAVKYEDYSDEASYIADRDAVLAENVLKADEFADVFLKNYKKYGMDAVAMAFEAMDK